MGEATGMKLQGKTALVTGSDSGIGRSVATTFAREGADVVVHYHQDQRGAEQTAHAVANHGVRAEVLQADFSDLAQAQSLFEQAVAKLGRIDILVNNAGKGAGADSSLDIPMADFLDVLRVDLIAPWLLCQAAARAMAERGGGVIVNVTSVHEEIPSPGNVAYDAAKAGLRSVSRTLAFELAPKRVRINNVAPGMIATPMTSETLHDPARAESALARIPMRRPGEPQEIANVVLFLASDDASYVTGSTYFADGGLMRNVGGA